MNDDFDELDRALFALPLEAPPPGLRQSILNATVYARAQAAAGPEIRTWELLAVGIALAAAPNIASQQPTVAGVFALHGLDVDRPRNLAKTVTVE